MSIFRKVRTDVATRKVAHLAVEKELPNLLHVRHNDASKNAHDNSTLSQSAQAKLAPDNNSSRALVSQHSFESSRSLRANDSPILGKELGLSPTDHAISSDQCHKAFPLKAAPLKKWRAATKIQHYLSKWRKNKGRTTTDPRNQVDRILVDQSSQASNQRWPEEPRAPTQQDLEALTYLETSLIKHHGALLTAYKFIITTVRSPGHDEPDITKREFRIAVHLKASEAEAVQGSPGWDRLEQMYDKLLRLLRKYDGDITKAEFLRFPELLMREKALQERSMNKDRELLVGTRLSQRFAGPIETPQDALELFQKAAVALQLEPARTTNLLFQIAKAPANPDGLTTAIQNILRITKQFGAPKSGVCMEMLLASWALCSALAKQVISLGALVSPSPLTEDQSKSSKSSPGKSLKSKVLGKSGGKKYLCKVDITSPESDDDQKQSHHGHVDECNMAFWQALLQGEVVWNVGCGAEMLSDEDFETLLRAAWGLFDDFDAISCLLGPVGCGRLRPKLDALVAFRLDPHLLCKGTHEAQSQLKNGGALLQQIASICRADPRLARVAALFGVSFIADRMRSTANGSANFANGSANFAVGSAIAEVNRAAAAANQELRSHIEELLEGRKVQSVITSGHFRIEQVAPPKIVVNPAADQHRRITAEVLSKGTVKGDHGRPASAQAQKRKGSVQHDRLRPSSAQNHKRVRPSSAQPRRNIHPPLPDVFKARH